MIVIAVIFIIAFFHKSLTVPHNCTKEDFCRYVPANVCDNSLCQPFDVKDWVALGQAGLKAYTWSFAQKPFIRSCPFLFNFEMSKGYENQTVVTAKMQLNSGPYCNITTTTNKIFLPEDPDPCTGKYTIFKAIEAGDMYDACLLYLEPGVAFIYRTCRVNPPPPHGQGCASVYVYEVASGNCNRTNLLKSIQSLGIDFLEESVDCL